MKNQLKLAVLAMSIALSGCSSTLNSKQHLAKVEPLFSTETGKGLDKCLDDPRLLIAVTSPAEPDMTAITDENCFKLLIQLRGSKIQTYRGTGI